MFYKTCSTCLLQGGHYDFHNVPLVWEHHIPALIDLIEGRGIQNTSQEDSAFDGFCAVCGKDYRTLSLSNKSRGRFEVILKNNKKKLLLLVNIIIYQSNIRELWLVLRFL